MQLVERIAAVTVPAGHARHVVVLGLKKPALQLLQTVELADTVKDPAEQDKQDVSVGLNDPIPQLRQ